MPIQVEQLPGESIISATVNEPFNPENDVPAMFGEFIRLRMAIQGPVVLILDLHNTTNSPDAFSKMVLALANAAQGIRASKSSQFKQPPVTIFVGSGELVSLAAEAVGQDQYGGVKGDLCATYDEALTLARAKLSA